MRRAALTLCALVATGSQARAYPLLSPRPVPSAIAGPADPHVAAAFYNPAALAPLRGLHLYLDGGARIHLGEIDRAPIEGRSAGSAPIAWSGLDSFLGLSWDLGTDSVTLAIAAYTPYVELSRYPAGSTVRYHERWQRAATFQQTAAAAVRLGRRFFFGAAANFSESWIDYRYLRDAALQGGSAAIDQPGGLCGGQPCGLENPLAAQDVRLRGFGWGIGFSVGILAHPVERLWLGLSYTSRIFNTGAGPDQPLRGRSEASVRPAPGQAATCTDPSGAPSPSCHGDSLITTAVPDVIHLGLRVEATTKIEVEAAARWVHYGTRSQLDVRLQGGSLDRLGAWTPPPQFLLDRGLQDTWALESSARFRVGERLRLMPSLTFETSAVQTSAVSAAAIDAPKLNFVLVAEWHPIRHLVLGAHLGGTAYFLSRVDSRYQPRAEAACVDARYAIDACGPSLAGAGLPSASGNYTLFVIHAGAALGVDY